MNPFTLYEEEEPMPPLTTAEKAVVWVGVACYVLALAWVAVWLIEIFGGGR